MEAAVFSTSGVTRLRKIWKDERAHAIQQFRDTSRADLLVKALRRITDRTLRELPRLVPLPEGAALVAVGGYGRGELYPHSDVDLLILLEHEPNVAEEEAIGQFVTALWDLGLEVGQSTRTVEQCLEEASRDITVQTALLEARFILGARTQYQRLNEHLARTLDPKQFYREKVAEMRRRHARYQDTPYALEPNCKESPGGLRDLQVILWIARAAGFGGSWREIARDGLLTHLEARQLQRSEAAFRRLRCELHLLSQRREDRIVFDVQNRLAEVYGFHAQGSRRASELLMQRYYWAAKLVTQLNTLLLQNIEERLFPLPDTAALAVHRHFRILHGRLDVLDPEIFAKQPSLLLEAFLLMQRYSKLSGLSARTMRAIWHHRELINDEFRHDPANRGLFLQILQQEHIVQALRSMNDLSVLPRYLPVFRRIVGQMQHDLFHVYTVDQHILMVVRNLRRFTMAEHAHEYPHCSQLMAQFDRPWVLYLAALFHDIAKGRGGDHSVLGEVEVRHFAQDHGLDPQTTDLLAFLVREHLTMSSTAQKQDLSDPDVIRVFADKVGDAYRLQALYLLTVADIRGTSPKVWNVWKGKLLEDLFHRTLAALGGKLPEADTVLHARRTEALRLLRLHGLQDEAHEVLWKQLELSYFLAHEAPQIAWHTRHLYAQVHSAQPIVRARLTSVGEGLELLVWCRDRQDLFARLCAFFESQRLSILEARIHTSRHGYALDSFVLYGDNEGMQWRDRIAFIEHQLTEHLQGEGQQRADSSIRQRQSRQSRIFPVQPTVNVQPDEKGQFQVVSIGAADRSGLLHDIARCFVRHAVAVRDARVMTLGERVEDSFLVSGELFNHPRQQAEFERDLLQTLQ